MEKYGYLSLNYLCYPSYLEHCVVNILFLKIKSFIAAIFSRLYFDGLMDGWVTVVLMPFQQYLSYQYMSY